ncbi:MAG: glycoside hydrolase family 25 protein [Eubacteriaceae bacterium]
MNKRRLISLGVGVAILLILSLVIYSCTNMFKVEKGEKHIVKGVDLSAYQGEIDWVIMNDQNIDFAFIKATEGNDYVDPQFKKNWKESQKTDIKVGAYHFLNYDSSGKEQGKHFIETVGTLKKNLPPVVDLELYGKYEEAPLERKEVKVILDDLLNVLEEEYQVKPIIYTTQRIFKMYLGTDYKDYKIWIVDLDNSWPETLPNGEEWVFWQFSHRGVLDGYVGDETFIDMNLYNGNYKEFINEFF